MGGRGSAFKITSGRSNENFFEGWKDETYTNLPTKSTDNLKINYDTWVMSSTDNIRRDVMNKQSDFLKSISNKYKGSTRLLDKDNNLRIRSMKYSKGSRTYAAFVYPRNDYDSMQICFNERYINKTKKELTEKTKEQIDRGFWSKSDAENIMNHTVAHEYGHFVERTLLEKYLKEHPNEYKQVKSSTYAWDVFEEKQSKQIFQDIYKIKCEKFNDDSKERISKYSKENTHENFAEVFCNLVTTKKPTNWAKAMDIYLKENGIKC